MAPVLLLLVLGLVGDRFRVLPWQTSMSALAQRVADRVSAETDRLLHQDAVTAALPRIELYVKSENWNLLSQQRQLALSRGVISDESKQKVAATLFFAGAEMKADIRLKGQMVDHLDGDKWSLRVKLKGENTILEMKEFSLQNPSARVWQHEKLFLDFVRSQGLLAPRYEFVRLFINGQDRGIYALEEHFRKEMLESQGRRAGIIARLDADVSLREWYVLNGRWTGSPDSPFTAPVRVFGEDGLQKSQGAELAFAVGLMRAFQRGELPAGDVLDVTSFARYLAIVDLWNAWHSAIWYNQNYYFNPLIGRFEPIAFDAELDIPASVTALAVLKDPLMRKAMSDPSWREAYVAEVKRLAQLVLEGDLLARLTAEDARLRAALRFEHPKLQPVRLDNLVARAQILKDLQADDLTAILPPPTADRYASVVKASLVMDQGRAIVEFENMVPHPVEVVALDLDPAAAPALRAATERLASAPLRLPPTASGAVPQLVRFALGPLDDGKAPKVAGMAVISGHPERYGFRAERSYPVARTTGLKAPTTQSLLGIHRFLEGDGAGGLRVKPGTWRIPAPLILPEGVALSIGAGTTLRFAEDAFLLVRGATNFTGTAEQPVTLESDGPGRRWPGVMILQGAHHTVWDHVTVRATTSARADGFSPTGAVTIVGGETSIRHSSFLDTVAEDSLNVVRAKLQLTDSTFAGSRSDAFDGDFVTGTVSGCRFEEIGGDAVDVSGADVDVIDVRVHDVRDKGISIGEGSRARVRGLEVDGAGTGVAAKDGSSATVTDSRFRNVVHAVLMAYMKKPAWGAASMEAERVVADEHNGPVALAQQGSRIRLDGRDVPAIPLDVDALYSGYMKK